jgi:hypothetical protein
MEIDHNRAIVTLITALGDLQREIENFYTNEEIYYFSKVLSSIAWVFKQYRESEKTELDYLRKTANQDTFNLFVIYEIIQDTIRLLRKKEDEKHRSNKK